MFRVHAEAVRDGELGTRARSPAPSRLRSGACSGSSDPLAPDWEVESRRVRFPGLAQTCLSVWPRDSQGQGRLGGRCAGAVPGGRPQGAAMEKWLPPASVRPGVVARRVATHLHPATRAFPHHQQPVSSASPGEPLSALLTVHVCKGREGVRYGYTCAPTRAHTIRGAHQGGREVVAAASGLELASP